MLSVLGQSSLREDRSYVGHVEIVLWDMEPLHYVTVLRTSHVRNASMARPTLIATTGGRVFHALSAQHMHPSLLLAISLTTYNVVRIQTVHSGNTMMQHQNPAFTVPKRQKVR